MKRLLYLSLTVLTVLATASCEKGDTWVFYFFVCDRIFSNGSFSGGSVWLEVDRDKNFITLEMMGDNIHNTHFDIFYKGPAIRSEEYLSDYIWD